MDERPTVHPWIARLRQQLDGLEAALLQGDAPAVETASASVQGVLQQAPKTAEFGIEGSSLRIDMLQAAHRFGQLRQTVLRAQAQSERTLRNLMPDQANKPTYGRMGALRQNSRPSQAFLRV